MNLLFTICGRAGSKGIKNKNVRDFLNIPLPVYSLAAIDLFLNKNTDIKATIAVNTDSEKLFEILDKNPWRTVQWVKREDVLAGDKVSKIAVIRDTWNKIQMQFRESYDMVVDLDITSPLRTVSDIEHLILELKNTQCDVVYSVTEARRNPYFNMVRKGTVGYCRVVNANFVTRQDAPEIYDMNASLYAYTPSFLASGKEIFQGHCEIIKMLDTAVLDLDHENDFELMQVISKYIFEKYPPYHSIYEHCLQY